MRATIYLHIGLHKTGTTSIQETMYENRPTLLRHGINYLSIGVSNHGPRLISMLSDLPHKELRNIRRFVDTPAKAWVYNAVGRCQLLGELRRNRSPKFLISGEGLSGLAPEKILKLKRILDPYAARYRIVVYARHPYEFANSASLQHLKVGAMLGSRDRTMPLPHHKRKIHRYIRIFGRENVDIRIFNPAKFVDGDLISDFLTAIECKHEHLRDKLEVVRANESMSHEAAMILSEANIAVPAVIDGSVNRRRADDFHLYIAAIKGERFYIDPARYLEFEADALADIAWVNRMVGAPAFGRIEPKPASSPLWGEVTIKSIKEVVRTLVVAIEETRSQRSISAVALHNLQALRRRFLNVGRFAPIAEPDYSERISLPPGLEWLEDAVSNGKTSTQVSAPPIFDQEVIRTLGRFIHDLAMTLYSMKRQSRQKHAFKARDADKSTA